MRLYPVSIGIVIGLAATAALAPVARGEAVDTVKQAVTRIAQIVKTQLEAVPGDRSVFINSMQMFRGVDNGVPKKIGDELRHLGVTVKPDGANSVNGRIDRFPLDASKPLRGLSIRGELLLADGQRRLFSFDVESDINPAALMLLGTQQILPPPVVPEMPPETHPLINVNKVKQNAKSPYEVGIVVKNARGQFEPRSLTQLDPAGKLLRVELKTSEVFAIEIFNRSKYNAGAYVLIDGLTRFTLSQDTEVRDNAVDLVGPGKSRQILGFYRDKQEVASFRIGQSPDAMLLPPAPEAGTITVAITVAWGEGEREPPLEHAIQASELRVVPGPVAPDPVTVQRMQVGKYREIFKIIYDN